MEQVKQECHPSELGFFMPSRESIQLPFGRNGSPVHGFPMVTADHIPLMGCQRQLRSYQTVYLMVLHDIQTLVLRSAGHFMGMLPEVIERLWAVCHTSL